jgi:hypothetical protein
MSRFLLPVVVLWPLLAGAQQDAVSVPPPRPPFVAAPGGGMAWSVQIAPEHPPSHPKEGAVFAAKPPRMAVLWEMTFGKNQVGLGTITYSDGSREKFYTTDGYILEKYSNSDRIATFAPNLRVGSGDLRVPAFPAVEWLDLKNYVGAEKLNKQDCFKFQKIPDNAAWIDQSTRYPVKVEKAGRTYFFSTPQSFTGDVDLPAPYLAALGELQREQNIILTLQRSDVKAH